MNAANAFGMPSSGWIGAKGATGNRGTCSVSLIDRRTGQAHRVGGAPLTILTQDPQSAVAELLAGRDARLWEVRVQPLVSARPQP